MRVQRLGMESKSRGLGVARHVAPSECQVVRCEPRAEETRRVFAGRTRLGGFIPTLRRVAAAGSRPAEQSGE